LSSEPVKVVITPEKMAELREKYPDLDDETLKDVLQRVHVQSMEQQEEAPSAPVARTRVEEETESLPQLLRKIQGGEFTIVDYLMWSEMMDRKEERRRRQEREDRATQLTPETIAGAVQKGIKEVVGELLPGGKPKTEEEIPAWAKNLQTDMQEIKKRQEKEDEDKRLKETIKEATEPLKTELEKEREERKRLTEEVGKEKPKDDLETTKNTLKTLSEIDELRGKGETVPPGTPGEITLASKTVDKAEKVVTKGMEDVKDTVSQLIEFQLEREKRAYQAQGAKLPPIKEEEKLEVLKKAAGEPSEPGGA